MKLLPTHRILTAFASLVLTTSLAIAAEDSLTEAALMLRSGEISDAISMLERLEAKSPKNGEINMLLGDCHAAEGNTKLAIENYRKAQKKGENDAWLSLASLATLEYRINDAEEDIELYRKGLKKGRKTLPDESETVEAQLTKTKNMLDRVEKIVIIDSLNVDAEDFFTHYRLSPESGTLTSPDDLPENCQAAYPTVVYTTESGMQRIYASPDSAQIFNLVGSNELYGGEWDQPYLLGKHLNEGGDANYPFLMPDGITLYYANNGENSLGGYDIFISRKSGLEYLQPQNIGMPYNSPYNDYMLAIDETTGVGWWATDRNKIPGMVTIYVFIPSELRTNYDVDDPNLASRAKVSSIKDTWESGKDYSDVIDRIKSIRHVVNKSANESFSINIPSRGVLTSVEQFRNNDARLEMAELLEEQRNLDAISAKLTDLRLRYHNGDTSVDQEILSLERQKIVLKAKIKETKNRVVRLETR